MMDLQSTLVFVGVFVISGGILLVMSMFGIKQKSYEEALAEQRQQANVLLGNQSRPKPKDKKQKKAGKKMKEKHVPANSENEIVESSESADSKVDSMAPVVADISNKHHVEFKEPNVEEPPKEVVKKEESKPEPVKEKVVKTKQVPEVDTKKKVPKHQTNEVITVQTVEKEEVVEPVVVVAQSNGYVGNSGKEKKKKKSEHNTLQQLTSDKPGMTLPFLLSLVRKAELSRSEVQIVIDMLLNKQHEAPAVINEWSEGKSDPVQKLKKQLAEKEKLLAEEQEALVGAQAKLKEVRADQNTERSQLQQRIRSLEETVSGKQLEIQTFNNRLHSVNQKLQQLQVQLNDEIMKSHKLMEEHSAMQMQKQQLEMHLVQKQEADVTIAQLQNQLHEFQARNRQLSDEILAINKANQANNEHQQTVIVQLQHQVSLMQTDLEQKDEIARQLKETQVEVDHRLSLCHKQENELRVEISQLKSACQQHIEEIRRMDLNKSQSLGELQNLKKQNEDLEKLIAQLNADLKQLQEDNSLIQISNENISIEEKKLHQIEVMYLHNELASVKSQLQHTEKNYTDLDIAMKNLQSELNEQKSKNNELRKKNWKVMEALNAAESKIKISTSDTKQSVDDIIDKVRQEEQKNTKNLISRLFPDIKVDESASQNQWIENVEKCIRDNLTELRRPKTPEPVDNSEITKLQAQLLHYKNIIDDTEGMLNKLQLHIQHEEIHWRNEIKSKQLEIEALKEQQIKQLQTQLAELQTQLADEQTKQRLAEDNLQENISQREQLSKETDRLFEALQLEQKKNQELQTQIETNISMKTQVHNSSNGPSIAVESNTGN